jgi:ankyrin repeat protein
MGLKENTLYNRYFYHEANEKGALKFISSPECTLEMVNYEEDGLTSLINASRFNSFKSVEALINKGVNINHCSTYSGMNALMFTIFDGRYGNVETTEANLKVVSLLIEAGTDLNYNNKKYSAFILACRCEKLEVIKILLNYDIDVNFKDIDGKTGLDYLKEKNEIEGIRLVNNYILNKTLQEELPNNLSETKIFKI